MMTSGMIRAALDGVVTQVRTVKTYLALFSVALLLLGLSTPVAAAAKSTGTLYVLQCKACASEFGHVAILYYDNDNRNYTYMSWAFVGQLSQKNQAYPSLTVNTFTGTLKDALKQINQGRSNKETYGAYKAYTLTSDQVNGLREFMWYSAWTSPNNKPMYDLFYANCAHFTWSAMTAAKLKPVAYRGQPNSWFSALKGSSTAISR